jgi:hypothetical protein
MRGLVARDEDTRMVRIEDGLMEVARRETKEDLVL